MRVRLADVGDIPPIFGPRFDPRIRSLRKAGTGSGGGGGTTEDKTDDDAEDDADDDAEDDTEDDAKDEDANVPKTELDKAIRRRDRALAEKRKLAERIAELEKDKDTKDEVDPVTKANIRLVAASTRTILATGGVTDKDDQKTILAMLRLDDVEVDDDGPDEDLIEERIGELRRIFGGAPGKRRPASVSSRDKGGKDGATTDPDKLRYQRIMGTGR